MYPSTPSYTLEEAQRKLELYCAYQDRCHKEVEEKLRNMRMIPEAIDHIMGHLIQENYLNEERFARSFARGKFKVKSWGKSRIVRELKQRNISKTIVQLALTEIDDEDYVRVFQDLVLKRLRQLKTEKDKYKKRKKLADYLAYRGWPGDWIYEAAKTHIP
ncbi:regulatory protein RecX [Croceiramulus getboli]|nr:regulatory protein RecX [Flavobacteriaceae bacterium YJPT1-3]